ncbi:MAG: Eco57I restriction-modification methylase domain-containing protein, partial [Gaiellaceae bacterium]
MANDFSFAQSLRQRLEESFAQFPFAASPDEAQTEQDLIFRVLEVLGWNRDIWLVQPRAARKGRSDVPDMLLFPDRDAKERANLEIEKDKRFGHGVAIVESKRWDRPLDRAAKETKKGDDEREVPSSQVLRYLSRAETASDRRIQWGILTNGRLWRLYYQGAKSRSEEYLEIDLSCLLDVPGLTHLFTERDDTERAHWLRVFALMFGHASFVERWDGDRTFHLLALDEGRNWEARVARDLSNLVFGHLFRDLVVALDAADPLRPAPRPCEYLRELKEAALTLLYRLLFVLYAEDRDLLPVRDPRYDDYGLRPIRDEIAKHVDDQDTFAAAIGNYYGHLRGLFRAIDNGEPSLGLPPYNGGLFDPKAAPLLERVDLPDAAFAPLLDALSRHGGKRINYRDLSVQQLGSIYERLLEHEVVEKYGKVEVVADEAARKGSGSFYTHEVLVQFILERAVGPLVTERVERFRQKAEALAGERRSRAERIAELTALDPASQLLEIKVCDPAMGSGHFLVSLVDFLADRVLEAIADAPLTVTFADEEHPYE